MARKPVAIHWWIIPLPLLLLAAFVSWRAGNGSVGVIDAFKLGGGKNPSEYIVAKVAFIGAFILCGGVAAMFATQKSMTGVSIGALVGVMSAIFIAVGCTAFTDLQGPTGVDGRHVSFGMPLYVAGCIATLLLAVQVVRAAPGRED
jgi:hypothetical protein